MFGLYFDDYETPVFRPPSEANSFILRVTRGCAHNRCTFCAMYKDVPFSVYTDEAVDRQIAMAAHYAGDEVRRIFLADGDAFVLPTEKLLALWPACTGPFPISSASQATRGQRISSARAMRSCCVSEKLDSRCFILALKQGLAAPAADSKGGNRRRIHRGRAEVVRSGMKLSMMVIAGLGGADGVCTSCP